MNEGEEEIMLNPKVRLTAMRAGKSGFGEVNPNPQPSTLNLALKPQIPIHKPQTLNPEV